MLIALVAVGCGGSPDSSGSPSPAVPTATGEATDPATGPATTGPGPTAAPVTPTPTALASEAPATDAPTSSAPGGSAAVCAGNDDNRDFYAAVADAVAWPVYCPVLGEGWFVDAGQYRLAGGGWMEIAYQGPRGLRLELREGAVCAVGDCVLNGADGGGAAFGDMAGTLLLLDEGRLAIVVDAGANPSWTIVASGLDQAAFESIAAELVRVGD